MPKFFLTLSYQVKEERKKLRQRRDYLEEQKGRRKKIREH
jgi:hypothetical protein